MPVYGLPISLEASLNSLVELRPPTSWRVSGHGNDVTVVLRWSLCGSPSSDKTLDYDIDHRARSSIGVSNSHMWSRGLKRPQHNTPENEVKTRCSSTFDCRTTSNTRPNFECFQPLKLRKVETTCHQPHTNSSPVPVFLTISDRVHASETTDAKKYSLSCGNSIQMSNLGREDDCYIKEHKDSDSRLGRKSEPTSAHKMSQNPSPIADIEIREVHRTYLTPCCSDLSSDTETDTILLDEKSGLFTNSSELIDLDEKSGLFTNSSELIDLDEKDESLQINEATMSDHIQNDSGCASESNSTSLSHYVKHTLSLDSDSSSSQDGSHYKSHNDSNDDRASPADQRCSSTGSSISRSSFALRSCSSKTKVESFDSSNENTNLVHEKVVDHHSNDLDMVCLNEAENDQIEVGSASSSSSVSYWDSFDSFQSETVAPDNDVNEKASRETKTDSL